MKAAVRTHNAHTSAASAPVTPPRSARILRLLANSEVTLTLREVLDGIGDCGRLAEAATVTMLLSMRRAGTVHYLPRSPQSVPRCGQYGLTRIGAAELATILEEHPEWNVGADEVPVETGAMRGERPTIVRRPATACEAAIPPVNSVFALGALMLQGAMH